MWQYAHQILGFLEVMTCLLFWVNEQSQRILIYIFFSCSGLLSYCSIITLESYIQKISLAYWQNKRGGSLEA